MKDAKFIQIAVVTDSHGELDTIYALDADGVVWNTYRGSKWERLDMERFDPK